MGSNRPKPHFIEVFWFLNRPRENEIVPQIVPSPVNTGRNGIANRPTAKPGRPEGREEERKSQKMRMRFNSLYHQPTWKSAVGFPSPPRVSCPKRIFASRTWSADSEVCAHPSTNFSRSQSGKFRHELTQRHRRKHVSKAAGLCSIKSRNGGQTNQDNYRGGERSGDWGQRL